MSRKQNIEHCQKNPVDEFVVIHKKLSDCEDLKELQKVKKKEKDAPVISLEEAKKELGL